MKPTYTTIFQRKDIVRWNTQHKQASEYPKACTRKSKQSQKNAMFQKTAQLKCSSEWESRHTTVSASQFNMNRPVSLFVLFDGTLNRKLYLRIQRALLLLRNKCNFLKRLFFKPQARLNLVCCHCEPSTNILLTFYYKTLDKDRNIVLA